MRESNYKIYKGLQRPLVFKGFKGKFIYWAVGGCGISILIGGIIAATISNIIGTLIILVLGVGTLMFVTNKQKNGLYDRQKKYGIFIMKPSFKTLKYKGKTEIILNQEDAKF